MTEYHWPTIRAQAIESFNGELPYPDTEAEILEAFEQRPRTVINAIRQVADGPQPRSYWAIVKKRCHLDPATDLTATDTSEREKKIRGAANWIRNAGIYLDRESELLDELFNPITGRLKDHDTPALRVELAELWRQQRPRGERAEADHLAYMAKVKADRDRLAQAKRDHLTALNEVQEASAALNSERQQATA